MIGIYYFLVKAGIPYQDPSTEMEIRYAVNSGIGEELIRTGIVLVILGGAARFLSGHKAPGDPDRAPKANAFRLREAF